MYHYFGKKASTIAEAFDRDKPTTPRLPFKRKKAMQAGRPNALTKEQGDSRAKVLDQVVTARSPRRPRKLAGAARQLGSQAGRLAAGQAAAAPTGWRPAARGSGRGSHPPGPRILGPTCEDPSARGPQGPRIPGTEGSRSHQPRAQGSPAPGSQALGLNCSYPQFNLQFNPTI